MPFNIPYYLHRTLFYLTIPIFVVLFYLFGDTPEHFDLIYIGALVLSCIFCWTDKDTLGALVILLGLWCLSRTLYMLAHSDYILVSTYLSCVLLSFFYLKTKTAKVTLLVTLSCIGIELFWFFTEYGRKPTIHYLIALLTLTSISRELLLQRVFLLNKYFGYISGKIALDWQLKNILFIECTILLAMLIEYFIRHLAGFSNITYVYETFTLVANVLSGVTLIVIYMHYFHNQSRKHLPA